MDWMYREAARSRMRVQVKRLLRAGCGGAERLATGRSVIGGLGGIAAADGRTLGVQQESDLLRHQEPCAEMRCAQSISALSLSQTLSGWQLIENRAMLLCDEGSLQAHWLDGRRSDPVASSA